MGSTFGNNALVDMNSGGKEYDEMNISLIDYLSKFQPAFLHQLYASSAACLVVFRELPSLSQNFVLRLMFIEQPIPQAVISSWVKTSRFVELISCVTLLTNILFSLVITPKLQKP